MQFRKLWWIEFRIGIFDIEGNEKVIFNHKKLKIYFAVLCNCKKRLLRRIRTYHKTSKFTPIDQIIFRKPDLLFIDGQIQLAKNTFTLQWSKASWKSCSSVASLLVSVISLGFSNLKSKSLSYINHERSVDESISKHFSRIFANRTVH